MVHCIMEAYYLQKELNDAIELLDKVERREPLLGVTDQQLWKAQKIKQVNKQLGCVLQQCIVTFYHKRKMTCPFMYY